MSDEPLFEAKGISKDYETDTMRLHVLEKIDLTLYPNEIVAIIGQSGCGKSTLLRIIAGLIPASVGEILYQGQPIHGLMPQMSMVFQTFALYPWMTVRENIEVALKSAGAVPVEEMRQRTQEAIELIGLKGFEESYPREISGGMKQRVGMARALVRKPQMLFMDEPFSEVDAFTAETLRNEVISIWSNKSLGLSSVLFVSHDVGEVAYLADRIIVLGMHPGAVKAVIQNPIPRPRDYRSPDFLQFVNELHDMYGKIKPPAEGAAQQEEKLIPLLPATQDEIIGLLRYLDRRGGSQDIFQIGIEIRIHFDTVSVVIDAAKWLRFVETDNRLVSITETGKQFLTVNAMDRRKLLKKGLMSHPLVAGLVARLKEAPQQSLDRDAIIEWLKQELPNHKPDEQFYLLIRWGQKCDLWTYHKLTKQLSLNAEPTH